MIYTIRELASVCDKKSTRGIQKIIEERPDLFQKTVKSTNLTLIFTNLSPKKINKLYKKYNFLGKRVKKTE